MPFYKSPLQPFDPVIKDPSASPPEQAIRYFRDNFDGDGQDSNTQPPSQSPQLWQALTNIQPIEQSCLSRRWGYNLIGLINSSASVGRMYSFQNNITLARQLVYCTSFRTFASPESGLNPIAVVSTNGLCRMVDSRNYAYFYDGQQIDLNKWDGTVNVSKWGIDAPSVATISTSAGPFYGSTTSINGTGIVWVNPSNLVGHGNSLTQFATANTTNTQGQTQNIQVTGFGFAVPSNATITGITASIEISDSQIRTGTTTAVTGNLLKAGNVYGVPNYITLPPTGPALFTFDTSDYGPLWNGTWLPTDINNSSFGLQFNIADHNPSLGGEVFNVYFVSLTVSYTASTSAISVAVGGAGNVNLTVGRTYYCIYQNSLTGHLSDLNQASPSTGPVINSVIDLSNIPVSTDPQVDTKIILATADGGDPSILYFVAEIPNATTTYVDNTPEVTLDLNQQYLFTDPFGNEFGVTFNDPPPNGTVCIKHKGRLWMAQQQNLFFSKSVAELTLPNGFIAGKYEESWNPSNYFDISGGAETIQGLFSDGNVIYIGTQSHIRRIFGDSPTNFQQPEICHQDVGVLNQEVWQNVFLQGTPTGFMWITPDFKVMGSDGNTYVDLGHPIQDVLNSINPAAVQACHAMFVQQGPYDLYILAIPTGSNTTCDTHCVFNMRSQQWIIWTPADPSTAMLFNVNSQGVPMWLFASNFGFGSNLNQYISSATQDRMGGTLLPPVDFAATATSSWLHLSSPTTRKVLDELEVVGDPSMLVTISGASTQEDFSAPNLISLSSLVLSPFETYKIYLSGKPSKDKYYQLQFQSLTGSDQKLLNSYALRVVPWNTL